MKLCVSLSSKAKGNERGVEICLKKRAEKSPVRTASAVAAARSSPMMPMPVVKRTESSANEETAWIHIRRIDHVGRRRADSIDWRQLIECGPHRRGRSNPGAGFSLRAENSSPTRAKPMSCEDRPVLMPSCYRGFSASRCSRSSAIRSQVSTFACRCISKCALNASQL